MSEAEKQETNGTANGDVPEIELIIKGKLFSAKETFKEEAGFHTNSMASFVIELPNIYVVYANQEFSGMNTLACMDNNNLGSDSATMESPFGSNQLTTLLPVPMSPPIVTGEEFSAIATNDCRDYASIVAEACEGEMDNVQLPAPQLTKKVAPQSRRSKRSNSKITNSQNLHDAMREVLEEGMSLNQAAKKFKVSKTTLWGRVKESPSHPRRENNEKLHQLIYDAFAEGKTLSEVARSLKLSKSTVYDHKQRLLKRGIFPEPPLVKPTHPMHTRLVKAHRAYRVNGMSFRLAAEFFDVPLTTLWRFIKRSDGKAAANPLNQNELQNEEEDDDYDDNNENDAAMLNEIATADDNTENRQPDEPTIKEEEFLFEETMLQELLN